MHDPDREPQYDAKAEAGILALAEKPDAENQRGAAYCLGDVIAPGEATLQALFRLCASNDDETATSALHSVAQIAGRFQPAPVDAFLEATRSPSPRVRQAAVHGIGNLEKLSDTESEHCATRLIELLGDEGAQAAACENIGFFSQYRDRFVPVLLERMKGTMPDRAREAAIQSLGNAYLNDPPAPPAVLEAVRAATTHDNPKVVSIAKWAVACFDRVPPPPAAKLSVAEAEARHRELVARGGNVALLFFAAAGLVIAAGVAAFFSPTAAVVLGAIALPVGMMWWQRRKNVPSTADVLRAQIAVSQAKLDEMKALLKEKKG